MRLFHFSEDPDIDVFEPVDGQVWAIEDTMAVNYLLPRECPRVTFGVWESTSAADRAWFETVARGAGRVLVIESAWLDRVQSTVLSRYEFGCEDFELQDTAAGYWISPVVQMPIGVEEFGNLEEGIEAAGATLVAEVSLWPMFDRVVDSSLRFSVIRQRNAAIRAGNRFLLEAPLPTGAWYS